MKTASDKEMAMYKLAMKLSDCSNFELAVSKMCVMFPKVDKERLKHNVEQLGERGLLSFDYRLETEQGFPTNWNIKEDDYTKAVKISPALGTLVSKLDCKVDIKHY